MVGCPSLESVTDVLVFVCNVESDDVSVIDTASAQVVDRIPVGSSPRDAALTADGRYVFVTNAGSATASAIDTSTLSVAGTVPVGQRPVHVYARPGGNDIWLGNDEGGGVSVIDPVHLAERARIPTGPGHHKIAFTATGDRAVVTNLAGSTVTVIDALNHEPVRTIPVVRMPHGIAVAAAKAYACNVGACAISVLNTDGESLGEIACAEGPNFACSSADGALLFVAHRTGCLTIVDTSDDRVVASLPTGASPSYVELLPDSSLAVVACSGEGRVDVFDYRAGERIGTITVDGPSGHRHLTVADGRVFVPNAQADTVSVVELGSWQVLGAIPVGRHPGGITHC